MDFLSQSAKIEIAIFAKSLLRYDIFLQQLPDVTQIK